MAVDCCAEFIALYSSIREAIRSERKEQSALRQKLQLALRGAAALVLIIIVLLAAIGGMTVAITEAFKDTYSSSGTLTDGNDNILGTATTNFQLPLIVAPVLPLATLGTVSTFSLTIRDSAGKFRVRVSRTCLTFKSHVLISRASFFSRMLMHVTQPFFFALITGAFRAFLCHLNFMHRHRVHQDCARHRDQ